MSRSRHSASIDQRGKSFRPKNIRNFRVSVLQRPSSFHARSLHDAKAQKDWHREQCKIFFLFRAGQFCGDSPSGAVFSDAFTLQGHCEKQRCQINDDRYPSHCWAGSSLCRGVHLSAKRPTKIRSGFRSMAMVQYRMNWKSSNELVAVRLRSIFLDLNFLIRMRIEFIVGIVSQRGALHHRSPARTVLRRKLQFKTAPVFFCTMMPIWFFGFYIGRRRKWTRDTRCHAEWVAMKHKEVSGAQYISKSN